MKKTKAFYLLVLPPETSAMIVSIQFAGQRVFPQDVSVFMWVFFPGARKHKEESKYSSHKRFLCRSLFLDRNLETDFHHLFSKVDFETRTGF